LVETGRTAEVVKVGWRCIGVSRRTKDDLDSIKHLGQSYDGLIRELIRFWKKGVMPIENGR